MRQARISANLPAQDNAAKAEHLLVVNRALFVGAHPDDIEFYCGGLVHVMLSRGVDVLLAVATRGGRGYSGPARTRLEDLRGRHQLDSARILGGARAKLFDYPDKHLAQHVSALAEDLKALILDERPDVVLAWDADFIYNPHPDHQASADAARIAIEQTNSAAYYYGTREPDLWFGYGGDALGVRLRSLRAHRTETPWFYWPFQRHYTVRRAAGEGVKIGSKYAEVYRCEGRRKD